MGFASHLFDVYFSSETPLQAIFQVLIFAVGIYGIFSILLFFLRYYLIYTLARKLAELWSKIAPPEEDPYKPPSNKEDEMLRDEKKERKDEVERVRVERMARETDSSLQNEKTNFRIIFPKAIGKWQKFVLGERQGVVLAVAEKMLQNKTTNFWQTLMEIQKDQKIGVSRSHFRQR